MNTTEIVRVVINKLKGSIVDVPIGTEIDNIARELGYGEYSDVLNKNQDAVDFLGKVPHEALRVCSNHGLNPYSDAIEVANIIISEEVGSIASDIDRSDDLCNKWAIYPVKGWIKASDSITCALNRSLEALTPGVKDGSIHVDDAIQNVYEDTLIVAEKLDGFGASDTMTRELYWSAAISSVHSVAGMDIQP